MIKYLLILLFTYNLHAECIQSDIVTSIPSEAAMFTQVDCIEESIDKEDSCECVNDPKRVPLLPKTSPAITNKALNDSVFKNIERSMTSLAKDIVSISTMDPTHSSEIGSYCSINDNFKRLPGNCGEENKEKLDQLRNEMTAQMNSMLLTPERAKKEKKVMSCNASEYERINLSFKLNKNEIFAEVQAAVSNFDPSNTEHSSLSRVITYNTQDLPKPEFLDEAGANPILQKILSSKEVALKLKSIAPENLAQYLNSPQLAKDLVETEFKSKCERFYNDISLALCGETLIGAKKKEIMPKISVPTKFREFSSFLSSDDPDKEYDAQDISRRNEGLNYYCSEIVPKKEKSNFAEHMKNISSPLPFSREASSAPAINKRYEDHALKPISGKLCPLIAPPKLAVEEYTKMCKTDEQRTETQCQMLELFIDIAPASRTGADKLNKKPQNIAGTETVSEDKTSPETEVVMNQIKSLALGGNKDLLIQFLGEKEANKIPELKAYTDTKKQLETKTVKLAAKQPAPEKKAAPKQAAASNKGDSKSSGDSEGSKSSGSSSSSASLGNDLSGRPAYVYNPNGETTDTPPQRLSSDINTNMQNFYNEAAKRMIGQQDDFKSQISDIKEDLRAANAPVKKRSPKSYTPKERDAIRRFSPAGRDFINKIEDKEREIANRTPGEIIEAQQSGQNLMAGDPFNDNDANFAASAANKDLEKIREKKEAWQKPTTPSASINMAGLKGRNSGGSRSPASARRAGAPKSAGRGSGNLISADSVPSIELTDNKTFDSIIEDLVVNNDDQALMIREIIESGSAFKITRVNPDTNEVYEVEVKKVDNDIKITPYGNEADQDYQAFVQDIRNSVTIKNGFKDVLEAVMTKKVKPNSHVNSGKRGPSYL